MAIRLSGKDRRSSESLVCVGEIGHPAAEQRPPRLRVHGFCSSPIANALVEAARNGKEVTVVIELRARFDEAENLALASRLQDAGAIVAAIKADIEEITMLSEVSDFLMR